MINIVSINQHFSSAAYFGKISGVRDGDRTPGYLTQPDSPTMLPAAGGYDTSLLGGFKSLIFPTLGFKGKPTFRELSQKETRTRDLKRKESLLRL